MNIGLSENVYRNRHLQQGMSLVELMIAITLGLFLIWGVTQSFLGSKKVYRMEQGLSRIQENGRLAHEFIGYDIRNAGDYGCASGDNFMTGPTDMRNDFPVQPLPAAPMCNAPPYGTYGINMIKDDSLVDDEYEYAVYGWDNVPANPILTAVSPWKVNAQVTLKLPPKEGTDVLMVQTSQDLGILQPQPAGTYGNPPVTLVDLSAPPISNTLVLDVPDARAPQLQNNANQRDRIAVSDCSSTKIFAVADMGAQSAKLPLQDNFCSWAAFQQGASVRKLNAVYYFIADNGRGTKASPSYSLYRQVNDVGGADELLEGVEDMQLLFGIDNNGDYIADAFKDASAVTTADWDGWDWVGPPGIGGNKDMNLVRAVRYSLLFRTEEDRVLDTQQQLVFNGTTLYGGSTSPGGGDMRLRQVFTSTVAIRSRVK